MILSIGNIDYISAHKTGMSLFMESKRFLRVRRNETVKVEITTLNHCNFLTN